jgi:hypothetical protein
MANREPTDRERQTPTTARAGETTLLDTLRNGSLARHLDEADPQVHTPYGHRVQRRRRGRQMEPGR